MLRVQLFCGQAQKKKFKRRRRINFIGSVFWKLVVKKRRCFWGHEEITTEKYIQKYRCGGSNQLAFRLSCSSLLTSAVKVRLRMRIFPPTLPVCLTLTTRWDSWGQSQSVFPCCCLTVKLNKIRWGSGRNKIVFNAITSSEKNSN